MDYHATKQRQMDMMIQQSAEENPIELVGLTQNTSNIERTYEPADDCQSESSSGSDENMGEIEKQMLKLVKQFSACNVKSFAALYDYTPPSNCRC